METLKRHDKSSVQLNDFIDYIGDKMLVIDTQSRAGSDEVLAKLETFVQKAYT